MIGAGIGAVGSQLLARLTQHCTYATEVSAVEFGLGLGITVISSLLLLLPFWGLAKRATGSADRPSAGLFRARLLQRLLEPVGLAVRTVIGVAQFRSAYDVATGREDSNFFFRF